MLFDHQKLIYVQIISIPVNPALAARNAMALQIARQQLGDRHIYNRPSGEFWRVKRTGFWRDFDDRR